MKTLDLNAVFQMSSDLDLVKGADRATFRERIERCFVMSSTGDIRTNSSCCGASSLRGDALRILADDWIIELLSFQLRGA